MSATSNRSLRRGCKAILATAAIVLSTATASAATMQDLNDCQGSADIPRMIAACSSVAQDARLPADARSMALLKRGFGNYALDKMDAAQADFSEAIRLNPKNNFAHHELGLTLTRKGDLTGAIASFNEAIRLDPFSPASLFSRGLVYMAQDRLDEAMADFTAAIKLGADKNTAYTKDQNIDRPEARRVVADYYAARADTYYLKGDFSDAASDYDKAAGLSDPEGYFLIWETVAREQGRSADADTALSAALDKGQFKDWPKSVGELLVGRITPAAALAAAKNSDQICEAHYYTGIVDLKIKDAGGARQEFTAAQEGCPSGFREHRAAIADLKRMQAR
ncbi:tetratricopeptide repeat protein [Bradyrhizobium diazoefficiens]|nr:tetratricopeptide repeat protein [Bradyrhizobium diazoefficiens]MBR0851401.1 tetratricopeptide repeat protein [Bradyrhizobium diazoefficiens]